MIANTAAPKILLVTRICMSAGISEVLDVVEFILVVGVELDVVVEGK